LYREVGARRTLKRRGPPRRGRTNFCSDGARRFLVSHQHNVKTKERAPVKTAKPRPVAEPNTTNEPNEASELDAALRPDPTMPGDYEAPPLHGKTDPPAEMDEAYPTLDDERRGYHHHPNDTATTEFEYDPLVGDAAADLAGDFGSQFLEGATRGEDMSERIAGLDDDADGALDMLLDEDDLESEDAATEDIEVAPAEPFSRTIPAPTPRGRTR
jgi:hypothetical protein